MTLGGLALVQLLASCAVAESKPGAVSQASPPAEVGAGAAHGDTGRLFAATFSEARLRQASDEAPAQVQRAADPADAAAQANNPLADLVAFNIQNYFIAELSGTDRNANQAWLRYAQPFGNWLFRGSLPLSRLPDSPTTSESGIGDANAFLAYLFDTGNPAVSLGAGPLVGVPTATDDALGTDQWSAGAAAVYFNAESRVVQYGGLVTYQVKVGGSDRAPDTHLLAVQPFGFVQLGEGNYLRGAPIWAFNLETGDYSVPLGLGYGKVIKLENTVLNVFFEPQFTVLSEGPGQPEFQLFAGLNMQF